jgi:hypothetical protein
MEGPGPGDPVNAEMTGALEPHHRPLGTRSEPAVRGTRPIADGSQLVLQSAHGR